MPETVVISQTSGDIEFSHNRGKKDNHYRNFRLSLYKKVIFPALFTTLLKRTLQLPYLG